MGALRSFRVSAGLPVLTIPLLFAAPAAGQSGPRCSSGPGAAFGVTAYQCANCGVEQRAGDLTFQFFAEPVILEVDDQTPLRPGDIIEAVDGKPITTRAGAEALTYPKGRESRVSLRRDGRRLDVVVELVDGCVPPTSPTPPTAPTPPAAPAPVQPLRPVTPPTPPVQPRPPERTGRFGFAVECLPSCTRVRASDGTQYHRFDGPPRVVGLRARGAADQAGLQVGDVVTHVDGLPITSEGGALRLFQVPRGDELRLTLDRGGETIEVVLKAP